MINKLIKLLKIETQNPNRFNEAIRSDIEFRGRKLWILIFAVLIASIGLNINTKSVIIGAMLISPVMGPINGLGYGLAISDIKLVCNSVKNFGLAVLVTLLVSSLYFLLSPDKEATSEIMNRTSPSFFHALIGISGGIVGILAKSRKEDNNVVPGVAIATALLPPLCSTGYGFATGHFRIASGSLLMFGLYVVCMVIASAVTVRLIGLHRNQA